LAFNIALQNIYGRLFTPLALAPDIVMMARFSSGGAQRAGRSFLIFR